MESLEDIRAAIKQLDREQKSLINKIKHQQEVSAKARAKEAELRIEVEGVQDRWLALIARERDILDGADDGGPADG